MKSRTLEVGVLALCVLLLLACVCVSASAETEKNTVEVSTVDEFLSAIAPNTELVLAAGEYDLTTYSSYSSSYGDGYCYWDGVYDGYELVISGVDNLSITAAEGAEVTISTEPRYANVLCFRNVSNVTISGLTIGHTKEQGTCIGGVLYFENSQDVEILDSHLYGCGTLGITLENCQNVHVDGTEIYECSYGIAELTSCENVLFENCSFHDCNIIMEGFSVRASQYVALINSEIYDNTSDFSAALFYLDSPDVYVGGVDVHDNEAAYIFQSPAVPPTVESCQFSGMDGAYWVSGQMPLDADGDSLTETELSEMELATVTWEAPNLETDSYEVTDSAATETEERRIVDVSTVDELLAALGNNTEIYLSWGEYDLSTASGYGGIGGEHYRWQAVNDGYELVISDLENLTIASVDNAEVTISAEPRYANVLSFENVTGLTISDVTVGHTEEQGYCTGGVLYFEDCQDVEIQDSHLYGCGTLGVSLNDCGNVHVDGTNIYSCSYGCIDVYRCENVLFENGSFYDCEIVGSGFSILYSLDVAIINSEIFRNSVSDGLSGELFYIDNAEVYLGGLDIYDNTVDYIFNLTSGMYTQVTVESCRFRGLGSAGWSADGVMPVAENGMELTETELLEMDLAMVTWQATPAETAEVTTSEDGKIHVSTVDEFLAALAPNVTIYMEPGEYNLTEATGYGESSGTYYHWASVYDGYELIIENTNNLTIEAASPDQVTIVTEPRYANVLCFNKMTNLTLRNVKAGHTQAAGECSGGVIQLQSVYNAIVEGCKLYGCGTLGVTGYYCSNLGVYNCEIYECSYGAIFLISCTTARIEECDIHDVGQPEITISSDCTDVTVNGELMEAEY